MVQGSSTSAAHKKAQRLNPQNRIQFSELEQVLTTFNQAQNAFLTDVEQRKKEIIQEYLDKKAFEPDLLELLKPEIQKNLAFLHDYKQFVSRVKQNINVVLQNHYGKGEIDQLLEKASQAEGAIYWAASLMTEKLQTAFLLLHPERLRPAIRSQFRLHGLVLKYVRIYNSSFQDKGVSLLVTGESIGEICADSSAFGIIPQTLLDNALKYSTRGSRAIVSFKESDSHITLSVTSLGPKIEDYEMERIFDLFYRGKNAIKEQEEGAGFGLHLAQFVAKSLGSEITVQQNPAKTRFGYETTFSIRLPKAR